MDFKGVSAILNKYGEEITNAIQSKLKQDNTDASGRTYNSVDYDVTRDNELEIYYSGVVNVIDDGVGPNRAFPSINSIVRWMDAKGIQPRNLKTFAIRSAIISKGTIKRFGYTGTGVLNFAFSDKLKQNMMKEISSEIIEQIDEQITRTFTGYGFTIE